MEQRNRVKSNKKGTPKGACLLRWNEGLVGKLLVCPSAATS